MQKLIPIGRALDALRGRELQTANSSKELQLFRDAFGPTDTCLTEGQNNLLGPAINNISNHDRLTEASAIDEESMRAFRLAADVRSLARRDCANCLSAPDCNELKAIQGREEYPPATVLDKLRQVLGTTDHRIVSAYKYVKDVGDGIGVDVSFMFEGVQCVLTFFPYRSFGLVQFPSDNNNLFGALQRNMERQDISMVMKPKETEIRR